MMPKTSALILASGMFASSVMIYLGLSQVGDALGRFPESVDRLGQSLELAGRYAQPPNQIDVSVSGGMPNDPPVNLRQTR